MNARVKATGQIINIVGIERRKPLGPNEKFYIYTDDNGETYYEEEIDLENICDYWEKLKHQYMGMAMQGILSNPNLVSFTGDKVLEISEQYAVTMINYLKRKHNESKD